MTASCCAVSAVAREQIRTARCCMKTPSPRRVNVTAGIYHSESRPPWFAGFLVYMDDNRSPERVMSSKLVNGGKRGRGRRKTPWHVYFGGNLALFGLKATGQHPPGMRVHGLIGGGGRGNAHERLASKVGDYGECLPRKARGRRKALSEPL